MRSYRDIYKSYGSEKEFYKAFDRGEIPIYSSDYLQCYSSSAHKDFLMIEAIRELIELLRDNKKP